MASVDPRLCPTCGAAKPADAPGGLCPRCLLRDGLDGASLSLAHPGELGATVDLGGSRVLEALAATVGPVPRVLLRDTDPGAEPPVVRPPDRAAAGPSVRYRIDGEIARGGMGEVLKGRDPDLGRDVAVKVLRGDLRDRPEMVRRFVEEAQIGGQLQHPGIVPVYELGTFADRRPFFSMKLVKGHTLAALLDGRKDPAVELARFLNVVEAVAQTVAYAHARGVIHRDLKPSNVMVGSFGEVQVMDWGLAKVLPRGGVADDAEAGRFPRDETVIATARSGSDSDLSHAGSVLGTPSYMAPEQARGAVDRVDERADVFALGSILCEVLSGQPAFTGRSSGEIQRRAALGDTAEALARLDACGADAELVALARDCLAREPEDRLRDAGAVSGRLTAYLIGVQERVRSAERDKAVAEAKAVEERKRRRLAVALAASVVATMALGGAGGAYLLQQRQARVARADRMLGETSTLLAQARSRPEEPAGWRAALAAADRVDRADLPAEALARLDALARDARDGGDAAEADRILLDRDADLRATWTDPGSRSLVDSAYAEAFRAAGYDVDALGAEAVGARIRSRPEPVALALAGALDRWAAKRRKSRPAGADADADAWRRLVAAARLADPDPRRCEMRTLWEQPDPKAQLGPMRALAEGADVPTWPAQTIVQLALALGDAGDVDAAAALYRRGLERYPGDYVMNNNLASMLLWGDPPRLDEAIRFYTAARAVRPEEAHELAHALEQRGDLDEAIAVFRDLALRRTGSSNHFNLICLTRVLRSRGRTEEALAAADEAVALLRREVKLRPDDALAHSRLADALPSQGKLAEAVAEYGEAIRLKPDDAEARCNLAYALRRQGRYAESLAEYRLGHELGSKRADWRLASAAWVTEAERFAALADRLPAVLGGTERPADNAERLAFAQMAYDTRRYAAAARLWAEALEADPKLGDDRQAQHRYNAACCAALAAVGPGEGEPKPDAAARARLRSHALGLLRAELGAWSKALDSADPKARAVVAGTLRHWKEDTDLAGVRDSAALAALPESERADWEALWAEADRLLRRAREAQ